MSTAFRSFVTRGPVAVLLALSLVVIAQGAAAIELVMVESKSCHVCAQWNRDIGPIYPKTPEGAYAPLTRVDIADRDSGITFTSRPVLTPTFVLVDEGQEIARIEGYGGDELFWAMLTVTLRDHTDFGAAASKE